MNLEPFSSEAASGGAEESMHTLARLISRRQAVLFAGAGISMAVGLPSWDKLIRHMCEELGIDPAGFSHPGSYQALAEYYRIRNGSMRGLTDWMRSRWQVSDEKVRASRIHRLILELDFPIVYTTNYDANLERAYELEGRDFIKIKDAHDLALSLEDQVQIVKFHGDLENQESLVLAESDYFARLRFESPLDIKFRADALARSVLFLGYSMSDMNIRLLLYRLWEVWNQSGLERRRPPSFLFTSRPDPVQEAVMARRGIQVLSMASEDPEEALRSFLCDLAERVRRLRQSAAEPAHA